MQERILAQSPDLDPGGEPLRGYRLLERVGEDPFGVVYRATQPNVGREVAVRVVHEHRANDPAFVRRFEPDAQAVAALEHPHVAPVYDYWREPGRAYVVTRFLRGGSLRELLDRSDAAPVRASDPDPRAGGLRPVDGPPARGRARRSPPLERALRRGGQRLPHGLLHRQRRGGARTISKRSPPWRARRSASASRWTLGEALRRAEIAQGPDDGAAILADLISILGTRADVPTAVAAGIRNPYKGLRPFLEADAIDFFGREVFIERLLDRLSQPRSGVEVHRGRRAEREREVLGRQGRPGGGDPRRRDPRLREPGSSPRCTRVTIRSRSSTTPSCGSPSVRPRISSVASSRDPRGLLEVADAIVPDGTELLLIVDQFEEAFTLTENEDDRALFLESLRVATADPTSRLRVIVTLRADFYDRPLRYPADRPAHGSSHRGREPPDARGARACDRPAGGAFGPPGRRRLVPQIAADVAEQPGALPLVQYALTELYDRRQDGRLTLEAYREIGGVGGALAASAEHLYATRRQQAVRRFGSSSCDS